MSESKQWNRREFLQCIGYASLLGTLTKAIPSTEEVAPLEFAFVASAGGNAVGNHVAADSGVHVFAVRGDVWQWKQSMPSRSPVSLALHPSRQILYVANEIDEYERLPRGTVEAYSVDAHKGTLTFLSRQPLSLSGINPRHIEVSPDGKYLIAAIHGGGAYNVLPIAADGSLGRVAQILKEVGAGPHPDYQTSAHPHTIAFDSSGQHLLATDEGCDRISVFAFQHGRMMRTVQTPCRAASGPAHIAVHPFRNFLYVSNRLEGSIDCYRWRADAPEIRHEQRVLTNARTTSHEGQQLVISSSPGVLYEAFPDDRISSWSVDTMTGKLSSLQQWSLKGRSLHSLSLSPDGRRILAVDRLQHEVLSIPIDESGRLGVALMVAKVTAPITLIMGSESHPAERAESSLTVGSIY